MPKLRACCERRLCCQDGLCEYLYSTAAWQRLPESSQSRVSQALRGALERRDLCSWSDRRVAPGAPGFPGCSFYDHLPTVQEFLEMAAGEE